MDTKITGSFRIKRSDPHDIVAVDARPGGRSWTRLEELQKHPNAWARTDIMLFNLEVPCLCERRCCKGWYTSQAMVYANHDGSLYGGGVEYMTEADEEWAREEARQLLITAALYPEFNVYINKRG